MKVLKFQVTQDAAEFINAFSYKVVTENDNAYISIPGWFRVNREDGTLEVIEGNNVPKDLMDILNPPQEDPESNQVSPTVSEETIIKKIKKK